MKRPKIIRNNHDNDNSNDLNNDESNKSNIHNNNNDNDNNDNKNNDIKNIENKHSMINRKKELKCRFSAMSIEIFCLSGVKKVGVS